MRIAPGLMILLVWEALASTAAAGVEDALRAGLAEFEEGRQAQADPEAARRSFAQAARHFEAAVGQGARARELFLNLGNAHYLAGQNPHAIFAFRRGLRLDPDDHVLQANLAYARQKVEAPPGVPTPATSGPRWWRISAARWCQILAWGCYGLAIAAIFWFALTWRRLAGGTALAFALGCVSVENYGWILEQDRLQWEKDYPLVVIREGQVPLRKGNGPSYAAHPDWPALPVGQEGRRLLERGGWLQIVVPGGAVGWVPRTSAFVDED